MRTLIPNRCLRSIVLALLPLSAGAAAHAGESWFVFSIGDTPVGYASERLSDANGSRLTELSLAATLNRLDTKVEMHFDTSFRESAGGDLEWLRSDVRLSQQTIRVEAIVESERIKILGSSGPGAPVHERLVDRDGQRLLGPEAIRRLSLERLARPGDVADYSVFSPELQRIAAVRRTVKTAGTAAPCAPGGPATIQIEESTVGMPAPRTVWLDAQGLLVQDSILGPFGPMTSCRATREVALATAAGGSLPDEMYRRTLVRSNLRLADPAAVDRLLLRVRALDPARPLPDLAGDNQRVRPSADSLLVELRRPADTSADGAVGGPPAEYLQANALVESDNPEIVALARSIVGEERIPYRAALRLSAWVAEHLSLDLGVVMAPSTELVRDRRATCVGYATLLAALARASGTPARIAMGLVYYGGIWGGHAWTEVWIGGRWLPLDAAVYAPRVASATRLAAGTSSFQDGGGDLTARLGQLFGNIAIEIVEVEAQGRTVEIPAGRPAYSIEGSSYANPGLGLSIDAAGWTIEDADSVWPASLLVAFRRGDERIEIHELPAAPPQRAAAALAKAVEQGRAVFAAPAGGTVWLTSAGGPRSRESLRDFLARVRTSP